MTGIVLAMAALLFTVGIRDNSDWKMYYYFFKLGNEETDLMFVLLAKLFKSAGFEFADLYMFHMVSIVVLFFLFISRYTRNAFYVVLLYFLLDFVHLTNQIRYYFGFPILMLGLYYLFSAKRYTVSVLLIILSLLFHKGLFMLLLFIPAYYLIPAKRFITMMLWFSAALVLLIVLVVRFGVGLSLEHFDSYLGREYESSLVGGLFNALPYLTYLGFILVEHYRLNRHNPDLLSDPQNRLLMKLSFFPLVFLPASFLLQILGHRYILPFSIFWIIYYLMLIRDLSEKTRFLKMLLFGTVHFVALCSIYIFPDYFLPENHYLKELESTIKSIPYLKALIFKWL
ncbi:MAG: EpsG family protein [Weeksellaceae bacterium]|nr:EpsG family protein [Weeksellaceae bacterium]